MRGRMENRVVKSKCGGSERCVNAGGPYRSESAGSSSTGQQMRTDYSAVKKHMKGNASYGQTGSLLPPIDGFENSFMNTVVCPICNLRGHSIEHTGVESQR